MRSSVKETICFAVAMAGCAGGFGLIANEINNVAPANPEANTSKKVAQFAAGVFAGVCTINAVFLTTVAVVDAFTSDK